MSIGIYVHIPYCNSKCHYCDFVSSIDKSSVADYIDALKSELTMRKSAMGDIVDTIYIGGGTPTCINKSYIGDILSTIKNNYVLDENAEITIEANPSTVTLDSAKYYKQIGINRVSIGLQSSDDKVLKSIGRQHKLRDFINTVNIFKRSGITNISADIILGLPGQTKNQVLRALEIAINLSIKHISAYGLSLEKGTKLYQMVNKGTISLPSEDESVSFYDTVCNYLAGHKIYRYEISNFASPSYECKHNLNCWQWKRYIGVGVAAHSFINDTRFSNVHKVDNYIDKIKSGKLPISTRHKLILSESEYEYIMLGMRLEQGMDIVKFNEIFLTDFVARYKDTLNKLERIGLIVYDNHSVSIRPEKMYIANSILLEFM